jgi:CBS domain-containing protein
MTCSEALIPNYISLKAHQTVDESLAILHQYNIRSVPVVDETGNYLGMFNLRIILHSLIPIAIRMEGGIENAEFMGQATPEMARQLYPFPIRIGRVMMWDDIRSKSSAEGINAHTGRDGEARGSPSF